MSTLAAPQASRNPFRSSPSTPSATGPGLQNTPSSLNVAAAAETPLTPPPAFSTSSDSPPPSVPVSSPQYSESRRRVPSDRDLDGISMEEPPPYTLSPSANTGESTVEYGPARPFQPPPPRPGTTNNVPPPRLQNQTTGISSQLFRPGGGSSRSGSSLLQQLQSSLTQVVNDINHSLTPQPTGSSNNNWSSYPGRQQQWTPPQHPPPQSQTYRPPAGPPPPSNNLSHTGLEPPPRHPSSPQRPSLGSQASSDFTRDFYAAGTGENSSYAPPASPPQPPPLPQRSGGHERFPSSASASGSASNTAVPNDGRPTSQPVVGHPLLQDGKLLVYPKGFECHKCNNVGYKRADPLRPCRRCWKKYAKPFSGPLAYSFSSADNSTNASQNFQRPLLSLPTRAPPPPPIPPAPSFSPPPAHVAQGGYIPNHHGGFYTPPTGFAPRDMGRPPPGSVVYTAGDPRIGGRLCWRCDGRGNTTMLIFDRVTCEVCGGIGRTFD